MAAAFLEPHVEDVAFELLHRRCRAPFGQLAAAERKLAAAEQTLAAYRDA